jgi:ABC-2 type transport system permease protein
MLQLLRTEWLKIKNYPAFWLIIGITALSYPGINYIFLRTFKNVIARTDEAGQIAKAFLGNPFTFPDVWHTSAYASSVFVFIPAIVIIMLITNEYQYKTNRQNIIDGWSRNNFMTGKLLDVFIISLTITLLYGVVSMFIGMSNSTATDVGKWKLSYYAGLFALQTFAQLSLAFLIGFFVRRAFIALGIFVFYFIIAEPIAVQALKRFPKETSPFHDAGRFFPLEISDRMIPPPAFFARLDKDGYNAAKQAVGTHVVYSILFILLVWTICFWVNRKRDL